MLPYVEFAMNNAVHATTGCTPLVVNGLRHPRVPMTLSLGPCGAATLGVGYIFPTKVLRHESRKGRLWRIRPLRVSSQRNRA
jgi:hypothetical protein